MNGLMETALTPIAEGVGGAVAPVAVNALGPLLQAPQSPAMQIAVAQQKSAATYEPMAGGSKFAWAAVGGLAVLALLAVLFGQKKSSKGTRSGGLKGVK